MTPEQKARQKIDHQLQQAGWIIQSKSEMNIFAGLGVAVREFPLNTGFADIHAVCRWQGRRGR
jgi:type I restriction enzyme, R subunit